MPFVLPVLTAWLVLSSGTPTTAPRLRVTPLLGLSPLRIRVTVRVVPDPADRLIDVVAVLDAEPAIVVCRHQQESRHDVRSQTVAVEWELPTGTYVIVACVTGQARGRCAEQSVTVR